MLKSVGLHKQWLSAWLSVHYRLSGKLDRDVTSTARNAITKQLCNGMWYEYSCDCCSIKLITQCVCTCAVMYLCYVLWSFFVCYLEYIIQVNQVMLHSIHMIWCLVAAKYAMATHLIHCFMNKATLKLIILPTMLCVSINFDKS